MTREAPAQDLPIHSRDEPVGPLKDLPLGGRAAASAPADLPLFSGRAPADDAPLVAPPAVPRAPLAVRKANPARARQRAAAPAEELEFDLQVRPAAGSADQPKPAKPRSAAVPEPASPQETRGAAAASRAARVMAGCLDLLIAGSIDAAVVYFTLRLCGLTFEELAILPKAPLLGFLLMLNGGYFVLFTAAGGQTIGKMTAGIRVVADPDETSPAVRVTFQAALVRAIVFFLTLLPAGIGLLPVLVREDGRGLHDRLARTRVVQA